MKSWLIAAVAIGGAVAPKRPVDPGIDVLIQDSLHLVRGRRVGLVANHAAVDRSGTSAVDRLMGAGVTLVALFSPEHGFRGALAPGEAVASTIDSATGIPIYSLYGRRSAPTDSMLANLDVILVDLPDVGARYFTYVSTTIEVMRVAGRMKIPVVVLDRPNPIGGTVQGNVLDPAARSFIGALAVPMRHGLTLGELARLARADLEIPVTLTVVPTRGWRRKATQLETKLPFVPPSPNLRDVESLFHYPGTCLFEGTALSVGRGTEHPFRQIGAPWLDTGAVLRRVRQAKLPGVGFSGVEMRPNKPGDGKFDGVTFPGIRLDLRDPSRYDPVKTALVLLTAIREVHPDKLAIDSTHFDRLAGGSRLRQQLAQGAEVEEVVKSWKADIKRFCRRVRQFKIY